MTALNERLIDKYIKSYMTIQQLVESLLEYVKEKYELDGDFTLSDSEFSEIVPENKEDDVINEMVNSGKWIRLIEGFTVEPNVTSQWKVS